MAVQQSMWRVNDIVAYDVMRELSASLQARILERVRQGDRSARAELLDVRRTTMAVDGYDPSAVEAFTQQIQGRESELAQGHRVPSDATAPLTPNEIDEIYRSVIQPTLFDGSPGGESLPTLVLLGGQPGSGISRASARLLAGHDAMVALTGDVLRIYHPHYRELVSAQLEQAGDVFAEATRPWARAAIEDSLTARRSLLLEGAFGDPEVTLATAARFRDAGFHVRVVAIASPRVLSIVTATSRYLRDLRMGAVARFTRLSAHDHGYDGTARLLDVLEATTAADRMTIISRSGDVLLDKSTDTSETTPLFRGARQVLDDGRYPDSWGARSTMELLGELKRVTNFAIESGNLTPAIADLLIEAHARTLDDVVPRLSIDGASPQATFIHQAVTEQLVALRRAATRLHPLPAWIATETDFRAMSNLDLEPDR